MPRGLRRGAAAPWSYCGPTGGNSRPRVPDGGEGRARGGAPGARPDCAPRWLWRTCAGAGGVRVWGRAGFWRGRLPPPLPLPRPCPAGGRAAMHLRGPLPSGPFRGFGFNWYYSAHSFKSSFLSGRGRASSIDTSPAIFLPTWEGGEWPGRRGPFVRVAQGGRGVFRNRRALKSGGSERGPARCAGGGICVRSAKHAVSGWLGVEGGPYAAAALH